MSIRMDVMERLVTGVIRLSTRRRVLAGGVTVVVLAGVARAENAWPGTGRLAFDVWRHGDRIGRHALTLSGSEKDFTVAIDAHMEVRLGPIPLFRYHFQASEVWRGGRFSRLDSETSQNGGRDQVTAIRTANAVLVQGSQGARSLAPNALPLTHWNEAALGGPLFNPQTGLAMRESVTRQSGAGMRTPDGRPAASRYTLAGEVEILDWYDQTRAWAALRAKASDGSWVDYRRAA